MKYEKPIVLINEELAESVYAASGAGGDCYTVTTRIHQEPETGRGDYRIQVDAIHAAGDSHHSGKQTLILYFNQAVTYKSSNGSLAGGDGTASISIDYSYHNNDYDNIGLGDVIVESDAGLDVSGAQLICNHDCGQH
ncbi:MAG: hypothetical protein NC331_03005 [Lachnospiraceae bacterium]|nr:hypothetical protein [Lachnospiraceae bacterium]MCM1238336.1 hypothetical protein [Lachnospiraceae bacterium]